MAGVVIVGDRDGFPVGTAAGNYVRLVAAGLRAAGTDVDVVPETPVPSSTALWRCLRQMARRTPRDAVVYYGHSIPMMLVTRIVAWIVRAPFVLQVVEWPPAHPHGSRRAAATATAFGLLAFRVPDAAIVISRDLEQRARRQRRRRSFPVHRLPILVDATVPRPPPPSGSTTSYVAYCGDLDGYRSDALACIDAVAEQAGTGLSLALVGRASPETAAVLRAHAIRRGVEGRLDLKTAVLPYDELLSLYAGAEALLAPIPDDERSRARFPSKLADYLLTGRPVVASGVGEVAYLLVDGESAYLAPPGEGARGLAEALGRSLADDRRTEVGERGRQVALRELDHVEHGHRLMAFLHDLVRRAKPR